MILVKQYLNPFHMHQVVRMMYKYQNDEITRFFYDTGKVNPIQYLNGIHDLHFYLDHHPGSTVYNEQEYNRMIFAQSSY